MEEDDDVENDGNLNRPNKKDKEKGSKRRPKAKVSGFFFKN